MERIIYNTSGLKCDNQSCDWVDKDIPYTEWLSWIDKLCPKCSSNLFNCAEINDWPIVSTISQIVQPHLIMSSTHYFLLK